MFSRPLVHNEIDSERAFLPGCIVVIVSLNTRTEERCVDTYHLSWPSSFH